MPRDRPRSAPAHAARLGGAAARRWGSVVMAAMLGLAASPASGEPAASNRPKLVVGGDREYPPYEFLDEQGQPTGYNVELTRAIARVMGLDVTIRLGPWAEVRAELESGRIDAVEGLFVSEERRRSFLFTPAHTIIHHSLFADESASAVQRIEDLSGRRLALMRGDITHDFVLASLPDARLVLVDTQADALRAVAAGQAEYALVALVPGLHWLRELDLKGVVPVGGPLLPYPYAYGVRRDRAELAATLATGLSILQRNGEFARISERWLAPEQSAWSTRTVLTVLASVLVPSAFLALLLWSWSGRRQARVLAESERKFRTLVQNLPGAAYRCACDEHWTMHYISDAVETLTGHPASDFIANRITYASFIHPDDRELVERGVLAGVAERRPFVLEYRLVARDGTVRWVWERGRAVFDHHKLRYLDGVVLDVSERHRTDEELRRAIAETQVAMRVKTEFLANISHELRTPLNGMMGMSAMLEAALPEGPARKQAEVLRASTETLLAMITDLLDLSATEFGRLRIVEVPFEPAATIRDLLALLRPAAEAKGLRLEEDIDPALAQKSLGDPVRFKQIVANLVGNALKFTDRGAITVTARRQSGSTADEIEVEVKDTGIGIPEAEQAAIFERFTQGDSSASRQHGGMGIGLALSRELCERMGGTIAVESELGRGSRFRFRLPLPAAPVSQGSAEAPVAEREVDFSGASVLVVEDNPVNQKVAVAMLESFGCKVHVAGDGFEGLAAIESRDATVDLVLMDCHLPRMDGYETTRRIRALPSPHATTPIVAMTASALADEVDRCRAAGMDDYLAKPVRPGELRRVLARYLDRSPRTAEPAAS